MFSRPPLRYLSRLLVFAIAAAALAVHLSCSPGPTVPPSPVTDTDGWTLVTPKPLYQNLNAVYAATRHDVWAVGDGGTIVRFDGWNSQIVPSGTSGRLCGIHGTGPSDIYAVGYRTILHFDGTRWTTALRPDADLRGVWCRGPDDVFAVGWHQFLHFDGRTWSEFRSNTGYLNAVMAVGSKLYAVGDDGALVFDGFTWRSFDVGGNVRLKFLWRGAGWIWAGGSQGNDGVIVDLGDTSCSVHRVFPSSGPVTGLAWGGQVDVLATTGTRLFSLSYGHLFDNPLWSDAARSIQAMTVDSNEADHLVFGVGSMGTIVMGHVTAGPFGEPAFGEPAIEAFYEGPGAQADRLFGSPDGRAYATTRTPGLLLRKEGAVWAALETGAGGRFVDLWVDPSGGFVAAGQGGAIVRGDAQGTCTRLDVPGGPHLEGIWGSGSSDLWVTADVGLLHYDGTGWTSVDAGFDGAPGDVGGSGPDDIWLAKGNRVLHWDGSTWSTAYEFHANGLSYVRLDCLRVDPVSRTVVVIAEEGGIDFSGYEFLRYDGTRWESQEAPIGQFECDDVLVLAANDVYVVGYQGLYHFDGTNWSRSSTFGGLTGFCGSRDHGFYAAINGAIWQRSY